MQKGDETMTTKCFKSGRGDNHTEGKPDRQNMLFKIKLEEHNKNYTDPHNRHLTTGP